MGVRKVINIDEEKCTGCGECIISCAEGALEIVDGKAKLIKDMYCDGLGACLGCPEGALEIIEREADEFDEIAVEAHLAEKKPVTDISQLGEMACGCPSSMVRELEPAPEKRESGSAPASALRNWPVQLHLVPTKAPYFEGADLLIAADCTGFTLTNLHQSYLRDRTLIIACPKLDDAASYEEKLAEIFRSNNIKNITILYMTVPCCSGLIYLINQALAKSGKSIPLEAHKIDFSGQEIEGHENKVAV
ncbi:MAG: 4Fe-4S binding protein [Deltaproteobacteria bacterium]|nr:4Fe-4S binding protein [Deltaproteobacteria bacterium]